MKSTKISKSWFRLSGKCRRVVVVSGCFRSLCVEEIQVAGGGRRGSKSKTENSRHFITPTATSVNILLLQGFQCYRFVFDRRRRSTSQIAWYHQSPMACFCAGDDGLGRNHHLVSWAANRDWSMMAGKREQGLTERALDRPRGHCMSRTAREETASGGQSDFTLQI
jgi:hypothetical protein